MEYKATFDNNVLYLPKVIPNPEILFQQLQDQVDWQVKIWNDRPLPRLCCHSVQRFEVGTVIMNWVKDFFNKSMGIDCKIHDIFGNRYRNGNDYLPDHSDQYYNNHVVSLSFGATRLFRFKNTNVVEPKFYLGSGDIIIFSPYQNVNYRHGIPKQAQIKDERINLTIFCTFSKNPYTSSFERSLIPKLSLNIFLKIEEKSMIEILKEIRISDKESIKQI